MAAEPHDGNALTVAEADELLSVLSAPADRGGQPAGLGLAVSGGADSVALMRLVADWRARNAVAAPVMVFTLDHGLRPGSADEAARVAGWAAAAGLEHETLLWMGEKPAANVQAAAREARYALLSAACRRHGLGVLATAHHLDDQAETFLLRLARGSGVDGLAGMAPTVRRDGLLHARPLLGVPKARLVATLRGLGQPWIEDPSNASDRFARSRMRALMPLLAAEGLDARRLAETAGRLGRARRPLEDAARALEAEVATVHPAGWALVRPDRLRDADAEIGLRVLSRLLMAVGGTRLPPRLEPLERLMHEIVEPGFAGATLAGCELRPGRSGLVLCREWGRDGLPRTTLEPGAATFWDNRFEVENRRTEAVTVGALGAAPDGPMPAELPPGLPRRVVRTMPAAFVAGLPVALPGRERPGAGVAFRFVALDRRPAISAW